jgi:putative peptidoglycan lipid II flippase
MFALAIATATLPTLSDLRNQGRTADVNKTLGYGLRLNLLIAVPATIALMVLAEPVATILLDRGRFEHVHVLETARSLIWQAAGIWAVASVRTVVPLFFAYNDTRTPVVAAGLNLLVFLGTALTLMGPMQHAGIAFAFSAGAVAQLIALLILLRMRVGRLGLSHVAKSAGRFLLAGLPMGVLCWFTASKGRWVEGGNDPWNIGVLVMAVALGAATYAGSLFALKAPELGELATAFRKRRKR